MKSRESGRDSIFGLEGHRKHFSKVVRFHIFNNISPLLLLLQQRVGPQEFVRLVSYKGLLQSLLEVD